MPPEVYSRPFVLALTATGPIHRSAVDEHISADSVTYEATLDDASHEHVKPNVGKTPNGAREKPCPNSVTGVPPSDAPRDGHTDDRDATDRYMKRTPPDDENCCPLGDTSNECVPVPAAGGDVHSSCALPTRRATTSTPSDSKRQRSLATVANDETRSNTRVPPATGPTDGFNALTTISRCT